MQEMFNYDHEGEWGNKHRNAQGLRILGHALYRWLIKHNFPPGFRCLCANCNSSRGYYGYCPHEREREAARAKLESDINPPPAVQSPTPVGIPEGVVK